jgi:D-apionolactonase
MRHPSQAVALFGTTESPSTPLRLTAGPLSVQITDGAVRGLCWYDIEVIRAIDCPVRDHKWATCAFTVSRKMLKAGALDFEFQCDRRIADGHILSSLVFTGSSTGLFCASMELTAEHDFYTNRAGFTVLHPLKGLTGSPLEVIHSDGSAETIDFPLLISPTQVACDISGLSYVSQRMQTSIEFQGEIFEMEDQRNWGDASYKTYCRPLALPVPYLLPAGTTLKQKIEVRISGDRLIRAAGSSRAAQEDLHLRLMAENVPTVAIALEPPVALDENEIQVVRSCDLRILQVRVHRGNLECALQEARELVGRGNAEIQLEIVVPEGCPADPWLVEIADRCRRLSLAISRVIALPEPYLRSYQPTDCWPKAPTPRDACIAARRAFPDARIGGGVLTNFTEFNRCRPDVSSCDYVSHGFTALVHAADDRSVVESLEGMSHVFASARALAGAGDYCLGLVSIGMRCNPYGTDVAPNPEQTRVPMARIDPRQRGLFAAAWAVGAVAATEGHRILSLALATPVGPFGIVYRPADWSQSIYEDLGTTSVYPLFHVFRALSRIAGAQRVSVSADLLDLKIVAAEMGEERLLLVSNLSAETHTVKLPHPGMVRKLDWHTFAAAITDPDWLMTSESEFRADVALDAFSIAFINLTRAAA